MIVRHETVSWRKCGGVNWRKWIENDPVFESYPSPEKPPRTIPANSPAPTCPAKCLAQGFGLGFWFRVGELSEKTTTSSSPFGTANVYRTRGRARAPEFVVLVILKVMLRLSAYLSVCSVRTYNKKNPSDYECTIPQITSVHPSDYE